MREEASHGLLSARGAEVPAPGGNQLLFDIINNPYDAEKIPHGYVSLGAAENALMHKEMVQYIKKGLRSTRGRAYIWRR
jgi:hypothetical protein